MNVTAPNAPNAPPSQEAIAEYMPLVHRIVAQFMRRLPRSVQREDLIASGTLGLFHALRSSAHTCPEMFTSYAKIRIRGAIIDELRRHDWSPRRRNPQAQVARIDAAKAPVSNPAEGSSSAAPAPVAPMGRVVGSIAPPSAPARIAVVGFDDLPPHLGEAVEEGDSPFDLLEEQSTYRALHAALEHLPARERTIVRMRYFEGVPSKSIAETLGLSEARISQLHTRATARLREILTAQGVLGTHEELKLAA